jgi:hypothetical protein
VSTQPQVVSTVAVAPPRRAVIDQAWRAIGPGVEVLSGSDGGPLRRTVKRILDPLVLRLRSNPQYSAPVLAPDAAAAVRDLIVDHAAHLRATAAWFALLKTERRRLRITTGNAQELYFPVCFELAVTKGAPEGDHRGAAEAVLRDIHRGLSTILGTANGHTAQAARQRVWSALIADSTPYNLGALARREFADLPWSIVEVGLSSIAPQQAPPMTNGVDGDRPLDRSVLDRVRATLRRALDRDELPDLPLLCAEEVDRACAPWGLLAEDKQATLVAGIEVAVDLAPLRESAAPRYDLARQIQARLRKEAYVLHARRYLAEGGPLHPRQRQVIEDLAAFARPYTSRLWARLHGRDVWQEPCDDVDDVRALLEGVARSVSLDHRQRIKAMLELVGASEATGDVEAAR